MFNNVEIINSLSLSLPLSLSNILFAVTPHLIAMPNTF